MCAIEPVWLTKILPNTKCKKMSTCGCCFANNIRVYKLPWHEALDSKRVCYTCVLNKRYKFLK